MTTSADFAPLVSRFFNTYLIQQRDASPHTVASYRDTFRHLVLYVHKTLGKEPQDMAFDDLNTEFLTKFLRHLENQRGNSARTRNARLAAIRSLFRFVALHEPCHAALAQQVLAIPGKRYTRQPIDYLDDDEIDALLQAPDQSTWVGRRDHALLLVAVQTGMRASELITLRCTDVHPGTGAHVRCHGKGRKERCVPLRRDSVTTIRAWLKERGGQPEDPVFVNQRMNPLTHDSLAYLVSQNLKVARAVCPTLEKKRVTPHTLRHSCAMVLLQGGVDQITIALWLGHESLETTYLYLHADLKLKEQAMAKTAPSETPVQRFKPKDKLLAYLNSL